MVFSLILFFNFHNVKFTSESIVAAVELSSRYINDKKLPDKAIDVLDETGAAFKIVNKGKRKKSVSKLDIENVISKIAKIPKDTVNIDDNKKKISGKNKFFFIS